MTRKDRCGSEACTIPSLYEVHVCRTKNSKLVHLEVEHLAAASVIPLPHSACVLFNICACEHQDVGYLSLS